MRQQLPSVDVVQLSYHAELYEMGLRAPKNMQGENKPRFSLTAFLVQFPTPLLLVGRCSSMCFSMPCFV